MVGLGGEVMQAGKEPVEVDLGVDVAAAEGGFLQVLLLVD